MLSLLPLQGVFTQPLWTDLRHWSLDESCDYGGESGHYHPECSLFYLGLPVRSAKEVVAWHHNRTPVMPQLPGLDIFVPTVTSSPVAFTDGSSVRHISIYPWSELAGIGVFLPGDASGAVLTRPDVVDEMLFSGAEPHGVHFYAPVFGPIQNSAHAENVALLSLLLFRSGVSVAVDNSGVLLRLMQMVNRAPGYHVRAQAARNNGDLWQVIEAAVNVMGLDYLCH